MNDIYIWYIDIDIAGICILNIELNEFIFTHTHTYTWLYPNGYIEYPIYLVYIWLLSLNMSSVLIHICAYQWVFCFCFCFVVFQYKKELYLFIHFFWLLLGCFPFWVIMNKAIWMVQWKFLVNIYNPFSWEYR